MIRLSALEEMMTIEVEQLLSLMDSNIFQAFLKVYEKMPEHIHVKFDTVVGEYANELELNFGSANKLKYSITAMSIYGLLDFNNSYEDVKALKDLQEALESGIKESSERAGVMSDSTATEYDLLLQSLKDRGAKEAYSNISLCKPILRKRSKRVLSTNYRSFASNKQPMLDAVSYRLMAASLEQHNPLLYSL